MKIYVFCVRNLSQDKTILLSFIHIHGNLDSKYFVHISPLECSNQLVKVTLYENTPMDISCLPRAYLPSIRGLTSSLY